MYQYLCNYRCIKHKEEKKQLAVVHIFLVKGFLGLWENKESPEKWANLARIAWQHFCAGGTTTKGREKSSPSFPPPKRTAGEVLSLQVCDCLFDWWWWVSGIRVDAASEIGCVVTVVHFPCRVCCYCVPGNRSWFGCWSSSISPYHVFTGYHNARSQACS